MGQFAEDKSALMKLFRSGEPGYDQNTRLLVPATGQARLMLTKGRAPFFGPPESVQGIDLIGPRGRGEWRAVADRSLRFLHHLYGIVACHLNRCP
jgi:hypothetical protein